MREASGDEDDMSDKRKRKLGAGTFVQVFFDEDGCVQRVDVHGRDGQWWSGGETKKPATLVIYKPEK